MNDQADLNLCGRICLKVRFLTLRLVSSFESDYIRLNIWNEWKLQSLDFLVTASKSRDRNFLLGCFSAVLLL